jgi:glycosyltransferase involved in cell wall biosynthesis
MNPEISICIPAYKKLDYLDRLFKSIANQSFKDFEIIVSDDTPSDEIGALCEIYYLVFNLKYIKNEIALGSPANWNAAIKMASGKWIKIMHNDDWFATENSLQMFADATLNNADCDFLFSGFSNCGSKGIINTFIPNTQLSKRLKKSPLILFQKNYIGHPSTTLIRNTKMDWFDEKIKWVVDFEFYIRVIKSRKFASIPNALINIGIHDDQITKEAFRNKSIEIPETIYLLDKLGFSALNKIYVYDYYWRLFRNLSIRRFDDFDYLLPNAQVPSKIKEMLKFQFKIPLVVLNIGILSKFFMTLSFLKERN